MFENMFIVHGLILIGFSLVAVATIWFGRKIKAWWDPECESSQITSAGSRSTVNGSYIDAEQKALAGQKQIAEAALELKILAEVHALVSDRLKHVDNWVDDERAKETAREKLISDYVARGEEERLASCADRKATMEFNQQHHKILEGYLSTLIKLVEKLDPTPKPRINCAECHFNVVDVYGEVCSSCKRSYCITCRAETATDGDQCNSCYNKSLTPKIVDKESCTHKRVEYQVASHLWKCVNCGERVVERSVSYMSEI